ncbi:unnamed protein product [Anisakis simplex]|uniref:Uncharacterized protein n=1 Tax=Anisakis simplex TaxID=6269 RepID=A0A0M3IZD2_ANISI|nr:unnamed protein product [Anisakis simplex]
MGRSAVIKIVSALLSSIIHFSDVVALNVLDAIPHHTNSPILSFQQQQGLGPASLPRNYSEVAGQCYGNYLQAYNFSLDASGTLPSFRAFVNTVRDSKDTVEILCELYNATHDCITTNVGTFSTYFGVFMTLTGGDQENALMYYLFFAAAEYRCHEKVNRPHVKIKPYADPYRRSVIPSPLISREYLLPVKHLVAPFGMTTLFESLHGVIVQSIVNLAEEVLAKQCAASGCIWHIIHKTPQTA